MEIDFLLFAPSAVFFQTRVKPIMVVMNKMITTCLKSNVGGQNMQIIIHTDC